MIQIRHEELLWNSKNLFRRCVDVLLLEKVVNKAIDVGKCISDMPVDMIFTSALIRAQMTAMLAMTQHHRQKVHQLLPPISHTPQELGFLAVVAGKILWPRLTPNVYDQALFWKLFTVVPVIVTAHICHHNGMILPIWSSLKSFLGICGKSVQVEIPVG